MSHRETRARTTLAAIVVAWGFGLADVRASDAQETAQQASSPSASQSRQTRSDPSGLYVGTLVYYTLAQMHMQPVYYLFRAGRVYHALPKGGHVADFDFDRAEREDPEHCGRYRIGDGQIHFEWSGAVPSKTVAFEVLPGGIRIDKVNYTLVPAFDRLRLDGTYAQSASHRFNSLDPRGGSVVSERAITFRPDGRFVDQGGVGAMTAQGSVLENARGAGTYRIEGNALDLAYSDGRRTRVTFFVHPESANSRRATLIVLDGEQLALRP